MSKVAIITTHYRNTDRFKNCVNKVLNKTKNVEFNWYIWANDPDDRVKEVLNSFKDSRIKIYYHVDNSGSFSYNNNQCIRKSNEEYVLLLNDDVEPINDSWLENMVKLLDNDNDIGIVGACLIYPNGLIQHAGVIFDEITKGLPYHIYYKQKQNKNIVYNRFYQAVTGACMLFKRKDWEAVNGLDERFWYNFEDISFCLDIAKLNKKIIYCGGAKLIHHEGISGGKQTQDVIQKNVAIFKEKHKNIINDHHNYLNSSGYNLYRR